MRIQVTEGSYKVFSREYPHISKEELERILKHSYPYQENVYLNEMARDEDRVTLSLRYLFKIPMDIARAFHIESPYEIELFPDENQVIYHVYK